MGKLRVLCALLFALALLPVTAFAQERGVITGTVLDRETGTPLSSASVSIQGTSLRTITDAQGRFRIGNVPVGRQTVSATQIGRELASQTVTVAAGQTVNVEFRLGTSVLALEGLVVSATGETQRAREVGNAVGRVNVAEEVTMASVNDISQVMQGRVAGVSVLQSSGTSGTGARIRIRGSNSVSLSNDPLMIIDGVRSETGSQGIAVGGQTVSRLHDMNPDDIESIEVLKGPAASALYGTAGANGVIVVTTKKGRAGRTRFNAYSEMGTIRDITQWPATTNAYCTLRWTHPTAGAQVTPVNYCIAAARTPESQEDFYGLPAAWVQSVTLDSIVQFNPLMDSRSTPFETGMRRKYGVSASGGTEAATYYLSADLDDEEGVYKYDLSTAERKSLRANIRGQLTDQLDVTVSTGYVNSDIRLPQNDNNALGIIGGALLSSRVRFDSISHGYGFGLRPEQISRINTRNVSDRITASAQANYRPASWLSFTGMGGVDRVSRFDFEHTGPGEVPFSATFLEGYRNTARTGQANYTANFNATGNFSLSPSIESTTSAGTQFSEEVFRQIGAFGAVLIAGAPSLQGANARFSVSEANTHVRTIGAYVQQQLAFNDRLFVTGAIRTDRNSAFGRDFGWVAYPALSASWVVREEPFFPEIDFLSTLRLRAAYGTSGLRPGNLDAFRFFNPVATNIQGVSVPAFTVGGAGNEVLRPEKSTELELGFDAGVMNDRVNLELTYYSKRSRDALVNVPLPPSLGLSASRRENLGEVTNKGLEALLNLRVIDVPSFRWDATVSASRTRNRLETLGEDRDTPIIFGLGGNTQRHSPGYPLGSYFGIPYTYEDANNDGVIQYGELTFLSDTAEFLGSPFPTREVSFQNTLQITDWVRLTGMLDYRGGFKQFNSTNEFRCGGFLTCSDIYDAGAPLDRQAAAVASYFEDNYFGYVEDASFVKLREVAVTLGLPRSMAERFRTQALSLTLSGRNLGTWTNYTGLDPEINFGGSGQNFLTAEFLTQPPARFFTARLDVSF
jgi:TonB-linked SusC/RagA family outer membrane protein